MEDILDLYEQPLAPGVVKVYVDERPYQLLGDTRPCLSVEPGRSVWEDYTYCDAGPRTGLVRDGRDRASD
jgi:hypothetical protein